MTAGDLVSDKRERKLNLGAKKRRITRDGILFLSGLTGIGYETVISRTDRPTLLLLFGAMIGLPAFLQKDDKDKEKSGDGNNEPLQAES